MFIKKITTILSLTTYLSAVIINPVYSNKIKQETQKIYENNSSDNSHSLQQLSSEKITNLLKQSSSSANSFSSQADNANIPLSVSVNPGTLQVQMSEKVASVQSTALSTLTFDLSIVNSQSTNPITEVLPGRSLQFNVPSVQLISSHDNKSYYQLSIGSSTYPFVVESDNSGKKTIQFLYTKQMNLKLSFDGDKIKLINEEGTVYLFKQSSEHQYLYLAYYIINTKGDKIGFDYKSNGFEITNNADEVIARVIKLGGQVIVKYKDYLGEDRTFNIKSLNDNLILENALKQQVNVAYSGNKISGITFPNNANYTFDYKNIDKVSYIVDGLTNTVSYDSSYVAKMTKQFYNKYTPDQTYEYSISEEGNNFAGNNIWCSKSTFDNLQYYQDWMMQCGFEHLNGNYGYGTTIKTSIPVLTDSGIEEQQMTVRSAFNYLHLPVISTTKVNGAPVSSQETNYDETTQIAKDFDSLSASYNYPSSVIYKTYDLHNANAMPKKMIGSYSYFNKSNENEPGYALGAVKSATDGYGNKIEYQYFPQDKNHNHQPIIKSELTSLNLSDIQTKTEYSQPKFMSKNIDVLGEKVAVSIPYIDQVVDYLNGKQTKSSNVKFDTISQSLTYGNPVSSTKKIDGTTPYIKNNMDIQKVDDNFLITSSKEGINDDTQDRAPNKIESEQKYYNKYGALMKIIDPISNDVITYDSYDALGRVTQIAYLPNNNVKYKQIYKFSYEINKKENNAGYLLIKTVITPTTGDTGYQTKTYYNQDNQAVKIERQTKDRSSFYITQENYYNRAGKIDHTIDYIYNEKSESHPQITRYFYNQLQEIIGIQHPDGTTSISINDQYHHRKISYLLVPTGIVTPNKNSMCFNPLKSTTSGVEYNTCKVSSISIKEDHIKNISPDETKPVWKNDGSYEYSIIMNPKFQYTDKEGVKKSLYTSIDQSHIESVISSLNSGRSFDLNKVNKLADSIKDNCLNGQCSAMAFIKNDKNSLQQITKTTDIVNGYVIDNIYNKEKIDELDAQSFSIRKDNGNLNALKTIYYQYDKFGNMISKYIASGSYSNSADKTLIGTKKYTTMGFLLSATSLINNKTDKIQLSYDKKTGLPTQIIDLSGNKVITHYDDTVWKLKPSSIDFYTNKGDKDFTINYQYNDNGDILSVIKRDNSGKQINKTAYDYDPITLSLNKTTVTYPDGSVRSLLSSKNNYFAPTSSSYQSEGKEVISAKIQTNRLGMVTQTDYTGEANFKLGKSYNPDLLLSSESYDDNKLNEFSYDSLNRLSKIENFHNGSILRSYQYDYNRKSQKSMRTAKTEATNNTVYHYGYSALGQLNSFNCQGSECPQDESGKKIIQSDYAYDNLFNKILSVSQITEGGKKDKTLYNYENNDPTQLSNIEYSNGDKTSLTYDANGNVKTMDKIVSGKNKEYRFGYDAQQNLTSLDIGDTKIVYTYDANGKQIAQSYNNGNGEKTTQYNYYLGDLSEQSINNESRYYLDSGSIKNNEYQANLTDGFNITGTIDSGKVQGDYIYSPFGKMNDLQKAQENAISIQKTNLGYRMMNTDQITKWQFLGDGYRAYNPELRIFMKHDSASPFGIGGINGYSYAGNDPINGFDPSGHATQGDMNKSSNAIKDFYKSKKMMAIVGAVAIITGILVGFSPLGTIASLFVEGLVTVIASVLTIGFTMGWDYAGKSVSYVVATAVINALIGIAFVGSAILIRRIILIRKFYPKGQRFAEFFSSKSEKELKKESLFLQRIKLMDRFKEHLISKLSYIEGQDDDPQLRSIMNTFTNKNSSIDDLNKASDQFSSMLEDIRSSDEFHSKYANVTNSSKMSTDEMMCQSSWYDRALMYANEKTKYNYRGIGTLLHMFEWTGTYNPAPVEV